MTFAFKGFVLVCLIGVICLIGEFNWFAFFCGGVLYLLVSMIYGAWVHRRNRGNIIHLSSGGDTTRDDKFLTRVLMPAIILSDDKRDSYSGDNSSVD